MRRNLRRLNRDGILFSFQNSFKWTATPHQGTSSRPAFYMVANNISMTRYQSDEQLKGRPMVTSADGGAGASLVFYNFLC